MDRKTYPLIPLLAGLALLTVLPAAADPTELTLGPGVATQRMVLTVHGPGELILEQTFEAGTTPVFGLSDEAGNALPDGLYNWELRLAAFQETRVRGADEPVLPKRAPAGLVASGTFSILEGGFVPSDLKEEVPVKDVLHYDDVIITGSLCVGFDCINGESFGYSTVKLKENNLQFEFDDTSIGTFPTTNWKIQINDTTSGGASYWTLWDVDGGRRPFTIEAGAPAHSLYVEDYGRVGLGTSIPYVELHIVDGDSPTVRLDQDGSSGWAPQSWDMCGNETNFFIRDVTNGSKLIFRIQPNAPSNSLAIRSTGNVGIGTWSPETPLEVERLAGEQIVMLRLENNAAVQSEFANTAGPTWRFGLNNSGDFVINDTADLGTAELLITTGGVVRVNGTQVHPDYVFDADYPLMPLDELAAFVVRNRHLPNVQSSGERAQQNGMINLSELPLQMLEKIEELVLYTIEQQKTIEELQARVASLESRE